MNDRLANAALPHNKETERAKAVLMEALGAALKADGEVQIVHDDLRQAEIRYQSILAAQTAAWERFGELIRKYRGE